MRNTHTNTAKTLAALDLGSNSTMLLVGRETAQGRIEEEAEYLEVTGLGRGVKETGRLNEAAIDRTLSVVRRYMDVVKTEPHLAMVAVATSAVREAGNGEAFLRRCEPLVGAQPYVINGNDEAVAAFHAAASGMVAGGGLVNVDIGGGSTEIAAGKAGICRIAESVNVGCVNLAEGFDLQDRASKPQIDRAAENAAHILGRACASVRGAVRKGPLSVVASGGTATTYASMILELHAFDRERIEGVEAETCDITAAAWRLCGMAQDDVAALPGVGADRAGVFPAGVLVLSQVLKMLAVRRIRITTRGLRYGVLIRLQRGELAPSVSW